MTNAEVAGLLMCVIVAMVLAASYCADSDGY